MISFDGPKEVQDLARPRAGGQGSFDIAAPKIKRLLEKHPHPDSIMVRATMTHQNHDTVALSKFFQDFGFSRIALGANVGFSFYKGPNDINAEDKEHMYADTEALLDLNALEAIRKYERLKFNPVLPSLIALHKEKDRVGPLPKIACGVGRNDEGIDVDGKVYPCHRYVGMSSYVIGDIWAGVNAESVGTYYRNVLGVYDPCQACWATRWCAGVCPQYLSDPTGKIIGPDSATCDSIRRNLERNIALYGDLTDEGLDWDRAAKEALND